MNETKNYLCTIGTSAAKNLKTFISEQWVADNGGVDQAAIIIYESIKQYDLDDQNAWHKYLSAEIHSLAKMDLTAKDKVYFFSSETSDGIACAKAVRHYLQSKIPNLACEIELIRGLQVNDASKFRKQGVVNYIKKVLAIITQHYSKNCVLNPTGGFKALVPYTALIGMMKRVPVRYIFERSNELLELPNYPIDFDLNRINDRVANLMQEIDEHSGVDSSRYNALLQQIDQESQEKRSLELQPLFEVDDDQVTLSDIGLLVSEQLLNPMSYTPYLSQKAYHDLIEINQRKDCNPVKFLQYVSHSEQAFEKKKHASIGNNFYWLNEGSNWARYLVSKERARLLVWRIAGHDEYEQLSAQNTLTANLQGDRNKKYAPFVKMDLID